MGAGAGWVIPLAEAAGWDEGQIGGKAAKLARLSRAGYRVPAGFCLPAAAYEAFVQGAGLDRAIGMELGRKPFESMRWEEIWDAALRIRSAFLAAPIPSDLAAAITAGVEALGKGTPLAVRSSAPGEDAAQRSFAGLHESVLGVTGTAGVLDAVRVVWASLWSDAALLYRQELALDPRRSRMAVVVQQVVDEDRSGVAFGRDPRDARKPHAIVEAVPGPCSDLVDGLVDPDRWIVERATGQLVEWRAGEREGEGPAGPILEPADVEIIVGTVLALEALFDWPADMEWTGRRARFTLLQARPITTATTEGGDPRQWYLSLRPGLRRLSELARRVARELIPELAAEGERWAAETLEPLADGALADVLDERWAALERWRQIYIDEFVPLAHGVRQLGIYYNDLVRPEDPYEFVGLLRGERMVAAERNRALGELAARLRENRWLGEMLERIVAGGTAGEKGWQGVVDLIRPLPEGEAFVEAFEALMGRFLDVAYGGERLSARPDLVLAMALEMARGGVEARPAVAAAGPAPAASLERRLLEAVGPERHEEAREILAIGRLSWRLRDDDNLLVGRLESQLLRAVRLAESRLLEAGRLAEKGQAGLEAARVLAETLRDPSGRAVALPVPAAGEATPAADEPGVRARQLIGQPAAPGVATGRVRPVRGPEDLGRFQAGEVLVCDAIQPTMTHLVPLACAIVERRGGMLIHGAIIARELGIPCVNGVTRAVELLPEGEVVTVDGYLGIVTVGPPEFDLEKAPIAPAGTEG